MAPWATTEHSRITKPLLLFLLPRRVLSADGRVTRTKTHPGVRMEGDEGGLGSDQSLVCREKKEGKGFCWGPCASLGCFGEMYKWRI
jgi:hypothetical protein